MTQNITWNWQQFDWPNFSYDPSSLKEREEQFLRASGMLLGAYKHVGEEEQQTLTIDLMSDEALKTSEIEGEILNRDSVQSSIRRQLGLSTDRRNVKPAESGIAEMMVDCYRSFAEPLTHEKLFAWHAMIMNGRRDLEQIGNYRTHADPMQVISGRHGNPTIHFEAPSSARVPDEMDNFIEWFNRTAPGESEALAALTRASIAHLYFECIHPFEDGNGRIGRSIAEKTLAQSLGKPAMVALSQTIHANRKAYYAMLEKSNKSNQIDAWLEYFAGEILNAQDTSIQLVEFIIRKAKFYDCHREQLNTRQHKVIERIFREGLGGFKGGLSAENYIRITGTSRATATRDLQALVEIQALTRTGTGKGTRYHLNLVSE